MKKYYIKTFGCQMNESDSQRIALFLEKQGYQSSSKMEDADLIVVVACSVRQTAIDRIFGLKKKFKNLEAKKTLTGCVIKSDKKNFETFFDEVLSIDEFLGKNYLELKPKHSNFKSAFIPIMTGCDNFCSYCVVPYTRGREVSRPVPEIVKEFKNLIKKRCREITLIGQNVDSFKPSFVDLLKTLNRIPGNFKIKFLTNHPKDMSDELINTIAECEKIEKEIHLPIQSGDNKILREMNRKYTVEQYKKLISKIYKKIPEVKITTDVIVGFPGETERQFQNTVKLFKEISYHKAYVNKYSPRVGTAAYHLKDDVPQAEKKRRWRILNEIANLPKKLIVIIGPTASGKSGLAVKLAKKISGEIVSADSRQVYKGMDIGTGKITKKEMQGIPHYCLNLVSPKTKFTVVQYRKKALEAINKIYKKNKPPHQYIGGGGKIPILCGGTGFYIQAVVDGLIIPAIKPDWKLRKELERETTENLYEKLTKLDLRRAKSIDRYNRRRLIRALEIIIKTGKPVPELKTKSSFDVLFIGLKKTQEKLKGLIKTRLLKRLKQGMIEEVKKIKNPPAGGGLSWKRLDDFGLEYRYIAKYLKGELTKERMLEQLQKEIEHYAKRQMTWFKRNKKIHWIESCKEAEMLVMDFLFLSLF